MMNLSTRGGFGAAAYKQTIKETESPRQIERRIFAQVTADLEKYAQWRDGGDGPGDRPNDGHEALARNQNLWGKLMYDLADETNQLPDKLRAQIISLTLFVDRHTEEVLKGSKKVQPLIDLNKRMMAGLAGEAPDRAAVPAIAGRG